MKNLLIFCLLTLSLFACRKESETFDGPSIEDLYGEFKVLTPFAVSDGEVDFAAGETAVFTATFNKPVNWTLTINGKSTGAQKIITGLGKDLSQDNALWNGSTTKFPVFGAEDCEAILTVKDITDTFRLDLKTLSAKTNEGLLLSDFETVGFDPLWTVFIQTGADMDFATHLDSLAPHGEGYLNMQGTVNWDWLIGLIDFNATAYSSTGRMPLSSDAENEYFNCLIYGIPSTNSSLVLFQFKEDDNEDGSFDANSEDEYDLQVTVDWEGWRLISVKYADLVTLSNGQPSAPKGNNKKEPNKINKVSMLHLANPANGLASTKIDYIIFTSSPLEP